MRHWAAIAILLAQISHATAGALAPDGPLQQELQSLANGFDGRIGICARDAVSTVCINREQRFSLQSVVKLVVAAVAMDAVDGGSWHLDDAIIVRKEDLSLFVQPLAREVEAHGGQLQTTIGDLVTRAITQSDSAASDILFARLGGATRIQKFLSSHGIQGLRIDRDERHLQTDIMGLGWQPGFVDTKVLRRAVAALPQTRRDAAYAAYLNDERDAATPDGMVSFLNALASGALLSSPSSTFLIETMRRTVTFPDRLGAGTPRGWQLAHKTGTSSTWNGLTAATNDVGILTAPDGGTIAVVAFVADSRRDEAERAGVIARAARTIAAAYR